MTNKKKTTARRKTPPRTILVPVDFSPYSRAALEFASELASQLRAELAVLHVVHDPGDAPGYYHVKGRKKQFRKLEDIARQMFKEFMQEVVKANPRRRHLNEAKQLLVVGLPVTRILEVIKSVEPRMVVMGSAGRTGLSHFLLGSKAEQLVRLCPVPITIVKWDEKYLDAPAHKTTLP